MNEIPLKFPRTPHLVWLGHGQPRDDKVLSPHEVAELLAGPVVVEEKIDGANVGICVGTDGELMAWNRGTVLGSGAHPQFQPLWPWLAERRQQLLTALTDGLVIFGEWCFAVHSVRYTALPDWFLLFDVYSPTEGVFWSTKRRVALAARHGLCVVPKVAEGTYREPHDIEALLGVSHYSDGPAEGVYVRRERQDRLTARAKLVRAEFTDQIGEHWSKRRLERNLLASTGRPAVRQWALRRHSRSPCQLPSARTRTSKTGDFSAESDSKA